MTKRTCTVPNCGQPHNARGFCLLHYMRAMRTGDPNAGRTERPDTCEIDGCAGKHKAHGLCRKHYARLARHGDPLAPARGGPGYQSPHGTVGRYEYHGCRCGPCSDTAREARRKWKESPAAKRRHADRARKSRREFSAAIADIKVERGCADCGYRAHPAALDFDHVHGEKLFHVSRGYQYPWETVLDEIAKCEVVCSNCHRVRTKERRDGAEDHHTVGMGGC